MGCVVAALADRPEAMATARAARAFAELLGTRVEGVHVREADDHDLEEMPDRVGFPVVNVPEDAAPDPGWSVPGSVGAAVRRALSAPDVVLGVVGCRTDPVRERTGHVALDLVDSLRRPLLVVPPSSTLSPASPVRRVLVPLDGALPTTERLEDLATTLAAAGVELIVMHVLDPAHVPPFLDSEGHGLEAIRRGFRTRHSSVPHRRLELRRGEPWAAIRHCVDELEIDVLLLSWGQRRSEGRAHLVRRALSESPIPVLLVPPRGPGDHRGSRQATSPVDEAGRGP